MNKRADGHEQVLENLTRAIRKMESAHERQINEIKGLARDLKTHAYTEIIYTDPAFEITDDETTQHAEEPTQRARTTRSKRESTTRRGTAHEDSALKSTREDSVSKSTREDSILKPTDALRMIENLNGVNDIGVEEFIRSIKLARTRVKDQTIFLRMIITEKITDRAKQCIRFCQISSFEELFLALRTQVSIPNTVSGSRNKMQVTRQSNNETVQAYSNRFNPCARSSDPFDWGWNAVVFMCLILNAFSNASISLPTKFGA
ncbi:hypothetical protein K0M31_008956 [Melipona bicolor]|uniref:Retrotransposon gag domain-containing protein n=1 Tax=Melipona bicolor TaxID=60889 RepID=A0AA40FQ89_9HYME|nr:hypothetical protein K0M31_008956 [Melipona bicolor]